MKCGAGLTRHWQKRLTRPGAERQVTGVLRSAQDDSLRGIATREKRGAEAPQVKRTEAMFT